jgi:dienelactone hydrolase
MKTVHPKNAAALLGLFIFVALAAAPAAFAAPDSETKCKINKLKQAGKAGLCRLKAEAKAETKGTAADVAKCASKLASAFAKVETKEQCRAGGTVAAVEPRLELVASQVTLELVGNGDSTKTASKCRAAKLKASGKQLSCVLKAQSKAEAKGAAPDFTKCDSKFAASFQKAETKAGGQCPSTGDTAAVSAHVDDAYIEIEADLADLGVEDFAELREYGVGNKSLTLVDSSRTVPANGIFPGAAERSLEVEIWYPSTISPVFGQFVNAPLQTSGTPWPVVVRAHGFGGVNTDSAGLTRHLASRGYIVIAPNFPLSWLFAPGGSTLLDLANQALDLSFLLDSLEAMNADPVDFFYGAIDTSRVGATGHSLGGATVLLSGYHVDLVDPRIDAVVALAPLACVFAETFYDGGSAPLMILGGDADLITPYNSNQAVPYTLADPSKFLVTLDGGTHMSFSDRLTFGPEENGDEGICTGFFLQPGDPRPLPASGSFDPSFLGGAAAGIDTTGSACEPICPLPPPTHMFFDRQHELTRAATLAFFEMQIHGGVSAARLVRTGLDSATDVTVLTAE